jgi:cysteinyl-tRNA synthetase, unknown class
MPIAARAVFVVEGEIAIMKGIGAAISHRLALHGSHDHDRPRARNGRALAMTCNTLGLGTVVALLALSALGGCGSGSGDDSGGVSGVDFRAEMRAFVQSISAQGRSARPGFVVVPQNGTELVTTLGRATDPAATSYLAAISGVGREDLLYGYDEDDAPTQAGETARLQGLLDVAEANHVEVLVTDYCSTPSKMDDSYSRNAARGYISFAADHRGLDDIPSYPAQPYHVNTNNITDLSVAKNFLYVLDQSPYSSSLAMVNALALTSHDLIIVDAFFDGAEPLTTAQVSRLKQKAGGGTRLVIAYMSIGEAESYRSYWESQWAQTKPSWLDAENPDWPGNYKVRYWDPAWQKIITGTGGYLDTILRLGFDGVYLDIIDAFEYFESK